MNIQSAKMIDKNYNYYINQALFHSECVDIFVEASYIARAPSAFCKLWKIDIFISQIPQGVESV